MIQIYSFHNKIGLNKIKDFMITEITRRLQRLFIDEKNLRNLFLNLRNLCIKVNFMKG